MQTLDLRLLKIQIHQLPPFVLNIYRGLHDLKSERSYDSFGFLKYKLTPQMIKFKTLTLD